MAPRARASHADRQLTARAATVDSGVNAHDRKAPSGEPVAANDDIDSGLALHDCTWHRPANGKAWISFPARSYEDPNGGVSWAPVVEFAAGAKKARAQFQRQALEAIHAAAAAENAD